MDNNELKDKLIKIINATKVPAGKEYADASDVADNLIASGIFNESNSLSDENISIRVDLPDGSYISAEPYRDENYPSINLYLNRGEYCKEEICFAEWNDERECLCVGSHSSDKEDCTYYEAFIGDNDCGFEVSILLEIATRLKMNDMEFEYVDDVLTVHDLDGNTWKGEDYYQFLIDEAFVYLNNGSVLGIEDALYADFIKLAERYQVKCGDARTNEAYRLSTVLQIRHPEAVVLYQVGNFFEARGRSANICTLVLNMREENSDTGLPEYRVPLCGFSVSKEDYITELLMNGYGVVMSKLDETGKRYTEYKRCPNDFVRAKYFLDKYCRKEFKREDGADYSDLSKIGIAYTTTEDNEHEIQVYCNLVDLCIETVIDDVCVRVERYKDLKEMICMPLMHLNFDSLVDVSDEEIALAESKGCANDDW